MLHCENGMGPMSYSFEKSSRGVPFVVAFTSAVLSACSLIGNLQQFDGAREATPDGSTDDGNVVGEAQSGAETGGDAEPPSEASADHTAPLDARVADAADGDGYTPPVNLVQNPGFEMGIADWSTFSDGSLMPTIGVSNTFVHGGAAAGYVTARTQAFEGMVQEMGGIMLPGKTYAVTAWALFDFGDAGDAGPLSEPVYVTAAERCLDDGAVTTTYVNIAMLNTGPDTWTKLFAPYTVQQCNLTALELYVAGPAAGVDLYVDDVSVLAE